jgi:hypothetical protein
MLMLRCFDTTTSHSITTQRDRIFIGYCQKGYTCRLRCHSPSPAVEAPASLLLLLLLLLHCQVALRILRTLQAAFLAVKCTCCRGACNAREAVRALIGHLHRSCCMLLCICD